MMQAPVVANTPVLFHSKLRAPFLSTPTWHAVSPTAFNAPPVIDFVSNGRVASAFL